MSAIANVVIVGAGPYGLSVAAHLRARGIVPRVFGVPMATWRTGMPKGMLLKSEGFASSLSDPDEAFTLRHYCEARGLPYRAVGWPVPVEVFAAYGQAFAERFVPQLDERSIVKIARAPHGFTLSIEGGGTLEARHVVLATGIGHFGRVPAELATLPPALLSHSSQNWDYSRFSGQDVVVVGAGASALDAAASLRRAGAAVSLVTRRSSVRFFTAGGSRGLWDKVRAPMTPLGPGWKKFLCCKAPMLFHWMPERFRTKVVQRYLGPAPGWFVRDTVEGRVPFLLDATVIAADVTAGGRAAIDVAQADGTRRRLEADHVVAATGYKVEVERLAFLDEAIRRDLRRIDQSPALTRTFEATVPGLYFVGTPSAYSFGPMLRFVCGAEFAARQVSKHIVAAVSRRRDASRRAHAGPATLFCSGEQSSAGF